MLTERLAIIPGPIQSQSWLECEARINWRLDWGVHKLCTFQSRFRSAGASNTISDKMLTLTTPFKIQNFTSHAPVTCQLVNKKRLVIISTALSSLFSVSRTLIKDTLVHKTWETAVPQRSTNQSNRTQQSRVEPGPISERLPRKPLRHILHIFSQLAVKNCV